MLTDARQLDDGARIETDVCIAGAGAAGITLARELDGSGLAVHLLEAGGESPDAASQDVYRGRCDPPLADQYLEGSRLRFLGGTTNHWLGYCRPLDADDFEVRDWVPHSGWPVDAATLEPYYRRAAAVCRLPADFDPPAPPVPDAGCRLLTTPFRVRATRFAAEYRKMLLGSPTVDLLLHASAVAVRLDPGGRSVDRLEVATSAGRRFTVRARRFVLALGGIENARLLLVSNDVHPDGVGNRRDLVGRFFMDHPVFPVADVCVAGDGPWSRPLHGSGADWYGFRVRPAEQERRRILNCSLAFGLVPETADTRRQLLRGGDWQRLAGVLPAVDHRDAVSPPGTSPRHGLYGQSFAIRPEQAPNPQSRVTLGDGTDRFGNRRVRLSWRLSEIDVRTARESLRVLAEDAGRFGLGRVRQDPAVLLETAYSPGFHHMGTTRMHDDPARGVVDRHCRVHGVDDLFVAGSSVFPTSGYANPTFTLVALAVRLADRLKADLR